MYKECSKCGIEYPATVEYFDIGNNKKLTARCKYCRNEYLKAYQKNKRQEAAFWRKYAERSWQEFEIRCSKCGGVFTRDMFSKNSRSSNGLMPYCKTCDSGRAKDRARYEPNINNSITQVCRVCGETYPATRDYFHKWCFGNHGVRPECKNCRAKSKYKYKKDPVKRKEYAAKYKAKYPEKVRLQKRQLAVRREARKSGNRVGNVSYAKILLRDTHCHICGEAINKDDRQSFHFDHVIPLARGGEHSMDNIKLACASCNIRKGDKLMDEILLTG